MLSKNLRRYLALFLCMVLTLVLNQSFWFKSFADTDWSIYGDASNVSITQTGRGYDLTNAVGGFTARYNTPVDLSEGVSFNIDSIGAFGWFFMGFGETKDTMLLADYAFQGKTKSGEIGDTLFFAANEAGLLRVMLKNKDDFVHDNTETQLNVPAIGKHTLKLKTNGTYAWIYIDEELVCAAHAYSFEDYGKLNANGGAYIDFVDINGGGTKISNIRAVKDWTVRNNDSAVSITEADEKYTLTKASGGFAALYNTPVDMPEGISFNINSFGTGADSNYFLLGLGETEDTMLWTDSDSISNGLTKPGSVGDSLVFMNTGGKLSVGIKDKSGTDTLFAHVTHLDVPAIGKHTVKTVTDGEKTQFYVDEHLICPDFSYTAADFAKLNGNGGAYISIADFSEGGLKISDFQATPGWTVFGGGNAVAITGGEDGYTVANPSGGFTARYNTPVDMERGITFNIESFGDFNWFSVGFGEAKNTMIWESAFNGFTKPEEYGDHLVLINSDGKLLVGLRDKSGTEAFLADETKLNVPAIGRHTIKLITDAYGYTRFYVDGYMVCPNHAYTSDALVRLNSNGGAYVDFVDINAGGTKISDFKAFLPPDPEAIKNNSQDWQTEGLCKISNVEGKENQYNLIMGNYSGASFNKRIDLLEGVTMTINGTLDSSRFIGLSFASSKNAMNLSVPVDRLSEEVFLEYKFRPISENTLELIFPNLDEDANSAYKTVSVDVDLSKPVTFSILKSGDLYKLAINGTVVEEDSGLTIREIIFLNSSGMYFSVYTLGDVEINDLTLNKVYNLDDITGEEDQDINWDDEWENNDADGNDGNDIKTGDNNNLFYILIIAIAASGICAVTLRSRKKQSYK